MSVGPWQIFLILMIILVLFGAGKLPNVMKDIGKGIKNLKNELDSPAEKESKEK